MKTLVTHINPHLDDISAIWLFKKFHPDFQNANLEFVSASRDLAKALETEDKIFLGTGGGKYDEHKGDVEECATSLVWKDILENGLGPSDEILKKALDELVEWNRLIDTGKLDSGKWEEYQVAAFIRPKDSTDEGSQKAVFLGEEILDRILEVLKRKQQSIKDWEKRTEFESKFGKSIAIVSSTVDREFCRQIGGDLFIMYDPEHGSVQYFTPSFEKDLEPIYHKVKELDPHASWFLHQSHHMVICGSGAAPDSVRTKLSLDQLIEVSKTV